MPGKIKYLTLLLLLSLRAFPQTDTVGKVKYSRDFLFNEGVYLTFSEFRNDSPSIKKFIISACPKTPKRQCFQHFAVDKK